MKKFLLSLLLILAGSGISFGEITYKGYVETFAGGAGIDYNADSGVYYGVSTSHGVTIIDGLFVGAGLDLGMSFYTESTSYGSDSDFSVLGAFFAEGRYNFLRTKRISPFVGYRLGVGFNGYDEKVGFYTSPAVGCTFNLTSRFGLDASLAYSYFQGDKYDSYYHSSVYGNAHGFTIRLGIHF